MNIEINNKKLTDDEFLKLRKEVLNTWKTGAGVDFKEAIKYQGGIPEEKRFSSELQRAKKEGITLIQPRAGVAQWEEHVKLLKFLEKEGGADLLPSTIDSYTRHNRYEEAEAGIEESEKTGRSMLNGFPAVNYGVETCRKVTESLAKPVQVRHGTPDARLLAEITVAGGFTSFEGGGISYNIPYSKEIPLEKTIYDWQYIDRLIGMYAEEGIIINREPYGPLTGTLVPPFISNTVAILEAILAAAQGCTDITVGYGQIGNLIQDVAAIKSLEDMTNYYLDYYGFKNVNITTVFHQWMGGFPADEAQAFGVISWGAATAALAGATKVIVKTPHEAAGVPTKEANAEGLRATKQVTSMLKDQKLLDLEKVLEEVKIINEETRCLMKKVEELGKGDIALGTVRAFEAGAIDIPFAPSRYNAGKLLPARDNDGAIRLLDAGNLPLSKDLLDFHNSKLAERAKVENRDVSFQMVIDDVYAIGLGNLVGRPNK